ncbi:hypothetical protein AVEN_63785-1 [Araneus ventricosus]|uniref:Endonuclease/exonuclease/phosphatase domain-containing protein n=1 Tax=Araneus ventricosus TaxID=182803 RepID=A0A4Y2H116_ARAVE|nr:hypothetical protein AVEN_63785-1 [Araneus ventricosus]
MNNSARRCSLSDTPSSSNKRRGPQLKNMKRKGSFKSQNATTITAFFWNAGGLSSDKFCELQTILKREDCDVFAIVEAGASTDSLEHYRHHDYVLYALPRTRQIASGIIEGVKNTITTNFKFLHKMHENKFEAVELQGDGHTFLSFKGEKTNPDLTISHSNIASVTSLDLLESCSGYGHKILCVRRFPKTSFQQPDENPLPRWNLRKADWTRFSELIDTLLSPGPLDEVNPDKSYGAVSEAIRVCALETIPRGRVKNYRPFWTEELADLKTDNVALRRAQAVLKRAIKFTKRDCFRNFSAKIDFRRDGIRAHRFLSTLKNKSMFDKNEILTSNGKTFTTNSDKALALAKYYATICRLPKNKKKFSNSLKTTVGCLNREDDQLFNDNFTLNELLKAMKETKRGKSAGTDDLPAELFLNLGKKAISTLLLFYNIIWNTHVPSEWRKAIIIPILKPYKTSRKSFKL